MILSMTQDWSKQRGPLCEHPSEGAQTAPPSAAGPRAILIPSPSIRNSRRPVFSIPFSAGPDSIYLGTGPLPTPKGGIQCPARHR